jgi:hypothetical protein
VSQELNEDGELVIVRNAEDVADSSSSDVVDKESEKDKAPLA